jgi:hypothetical protein
MLMILICVLQRCPNRGVYTVSVCVLDSHLLCTYSILLGNSTGPVIAQLHPEFTPVHFWVVNVKSGMPVDHFELRSNLTKHLLNSRYSPYVEGARHRR